jgi:ATP-dependent Clp protease ATP-binding subunit ClpC
METKFSDEISMLLNEAKRLAENHNHNELTPDFLLLSMNVVKHSGYQLLSALVSQIRLDELFNELDSRLYNLDASNAEQISVASITNRIIKLSSLEARLLKSDTVTDAHVLLALFHNSEVQTMDFIKPFSINGITYTELHRVALEQLNKERTNAEPAVPHAGADFIEESDNDTDDESSNERRRGFARQTPGNARRTKMSNSDTPMLDKFGHDMTRAAAEGSLDPVVGRETEIERLAQILSRRKKNNPVLIGEPGVGKSAIVEGLALRINQRKVSRVLFDKRVISLDLASLVAGTKYRGEFEERIKSILNELTKNKDIILFIDEIHTIVGAGNPQGSMDAANILKPALARGELQCIGATTLDEYRKNIEKDGALERRFQKVMVEPTTAEETLEILNNIKDKYEAHHNVTFTSDALEACVKLTERYISDRNFPDKAIDALDEAGSRVHITNIAVPEEIERLEREISEATNNKFEAAKAQNFEKAASWRDRAQTLTEELEAAKRNWEEHLSDQRETVDADKVAEVVAMMTGVPVQRIAQAEGKRLLEMAPALKRSIIGQDEAIDKVVKAIQRNRIGLKDANKPIGTFLFLGPTGVGKTHLAKKLAEYMFDSADTLIRIDMSEYMEKFTVSRLVGAPPGYVGYEEGGQLTERVRRHPYSIVLLDEIEKAHPDVFNLLLQVMDEGRLTDSLGRRIDFKNTIIIMTSNIGVRQLRDFGGGVGFNTAANGAIDHAHAQGVIQKALNKTFSPEFLNRVDDLIMFDALSRESIFKIIDVELAGFYKRVNDLGYKLTLTEEAKNYVAEKGYDAQYGARPLKRAIQKYLEDELAELIITASVTPGSDIVIDYDKESDKIVSKILSETAE